MGRTFWGYQVCFATRTEPAQHDAGLGYVPAIEGCWCERRIGRLIDGLDLDLLTAARTAALNAHAPYSRFRVGAAVLAGGRIYTGCNVENASYGLTICGERVAIFAAIAAGSRRIDAIALSCVDASPEGSAPLHMPCGACRQVMAELAPPDLPIFVDAVGRFTLDQLLPFAFRLQPAEQERSGDQG
jgi:cytidine deaminase